MKASDLLAADDPTIDVPLFYQQRVAAHVAHLERQQLFRHPQPLIGNQGDGYRRARPADVTALEDLVTRLGALAAAHPEVVELDCNPVMVLERGAVVVDARVRVAPPGPRPPWPALGAEPPTIRSPYGPKRRERAEVGPSAEP